MYLHTNIFKSAALPALMDKPAIIIDELTCSYTELRDHIQNLAQYLQTLDFETQASIGLILDNRLETAVSQFAIPKAGMIAVPMDTNIHPNNFQYIANDCDLRLIISNSRIFQRLRRSIPNLQTPFLLVDEVANENHLLLKWPKADDAPLPEVGVSDKASELHENDTALILYTTGTTGLSKGVELTHKNLLAASNNINTFIGTNQDTIESMPMPLSHSFGFARLRCVLESGGTIILEQGLLRPELMLSRMRQYKANALSSVPAGFAILLDRYEKEFTTLSDQLKHIEIGSAPMSLANKQKLMRLCPKARICMHYGLTEASRAAFIEFHTSKDHLETIGKASPNVKIKLVDTSGKEVPPAEIGEILVQGDIIMKSYWNKAEKTKEVIKDGWLHTGDMARQDEDGYLYFIGRQDDVINFAGLKIGPIEVERALKSFPGIADAAVVGLKAKDEVHANAIKAFIVLENDKTSIERQALRKHCFGRIESYKIPTQFEIVQAIPKTSSGKLKRQALLQAHL